MATLEQKVDLIMQYIVELDWKVQNKLREEIKRALNGDKLTCQTVYNLEDAIDDFLTEVGVPCHVNGYKHIATALELIISDPSYLDRISYGLYPDVAKRHDSTGTRVERSMRHAVEVTWNRMSIDTMNRLFGNTVDPNRGKPTNAEFLATCHKIIKRRMRDLA